MTDFKALLAAEELLPGYIDRAVSRGSLSPREVAYIRENQALIEAQESLSSNAQRQELSLEEYFVVSAMRAGDVE